MTSRRREIILCVYTCLWNSFLLYCSASDRLTSNSSISDGRGETLVSAGERFQLGFFTPNGTSSSSRYVGIWYYNSNPQTIVWVANRDAPISDRSGVFAIKEDGNLEVLDGKGKIYWSTNLQPQFDSERAKLLDSGNLILGSDGLNSTSWESFHNPTDTFLPGMKMDETLKLISWKSPNDPSPGEFTFEKYVEGVGQFITLRRSVRYWRNGQTGNYLNSDQMPSSIANLLLNSSMSDNSLNYTTRLVMKYNGELQSLIWDSKKGWSLNWLEPRDPCSVFDTCGKFGSCNGNTGLSLCKCLPGFEPSLQVNWNSGDYSGGCTRISPIHCDESEKDTFLSLKMMQVRNPGTEFQAANENECRRECLSRCDCQAFTYDVERNYIGRGSSNSTAVCWIWTDDLSNLMEECAYGAPSLYARVSVSDIEPTARTCAPCGTYMIPYPLSTGPNCGDPLYFSFNCNVSTAQVNFKALSDTYRVTSINLATRSFSIQAKDADNCEATSSTGKLVQLNQSLPFHVNKWCNTDQGNFSSDMLAESKAEIEIGWDPPLEPTCTTSTDCNDWPNSTCKMAKYGNKRCLCKSNFQWSSSGLKCTHEEPSRRKVVIFAATSATAIAVTALLCIIFFIRYQRRRRVAKRHGDGENIQRNQVLHLYDSTQRVKSVIDFNEFSEDDKIGIDVPFFDLESILAATDNFSDANKLGEGGFGTVYKGKFQDGQLMAVKRLTSFSGQGLGEFKNEVVLIAKLQHRNLVTLLGYCVEGEEKILLYEYMPNKSLDAFLVDRTLCVLLNWESRFNIILGIARGLLYLHQDSKLRIIHRDLKTSNILLDEEMTPKISDFGLARIFEGKQTESSTNRVIGTFGYMAPEYALDGFFSDKSDVFSFGVVVLEIISGKKNTGFYQTQQSTSLLNFAWNLWNEDKALDLMDKTLRETCITSELLKCIHIGLLCVQEDPSDRPTMSNVVVMLGSGTATLPTPKQPTFMVRRWSSNTTTESTTTRNMITTEEVR